MSITDKETLKEGLTLGGGAVGASAALAGVGEGVLHAANSGRENEIARAMEAYKNAKTKEAKKLASEALARAQKRGFTANAAIGARDILSKPRLQTLTSAIQKSPLGFFERAGTAADKAITGAARAAGAKGAGAATRGAAGTLVGGAIKAVPLAATEYVGNRIITKEEQQRIEEVRLALARQGVNASVEDIAAAYQAVGDPFRNKGAWFGLGKGSFHGGRTLQSLLGYAASPVGAAVGGMTQTNMMEGAYDQVQNAVYQNLLGLGKNVNRYNTSTQALSPEAAQFLYGNAPTADFSALREIGDEPLTEQQRLDAVRARNVAGNANAFQRSQEAAYSTEDASTRMSGKDAIKRGGQTFVNDFMQMLPFYRDESGNFIKNGTGPRADEDGVAPEYIDPKVASQVIDAYMTHFGGMSQDTYNQRYYGTTNPMGITPDDVKKNANSPTADQKLPAGGGPVSVTDPRTLPNPRLTPPTTPEEALNNIRTAGVARGLSPIAAEQENYINKQRGRLTAAQFDQQLESDLRNPESQLSKSIAAMRANAQARYDNYGNEALAGRKEIDEWGSTNPEDAGLNNAYKAFVSRQITKENLPDQLIGADGNPMSPKAYRSNVNPPIQSITGSTPVLSNKAPTIYPTNPLAVDQGASPLSQVDSIINRERQRASDDLRSNIESSALRFEADRRSREAGVEQMVAEDMRARGGLPNRALFNAGRTSFDTGHAWNPNNPVGPTPADSPFKQKYFWEEEGSFDPNATESDRQASIDQMMANEVRSRGGLQPRPLFNAGRTSFDTGQVWNPNQPVGPRPADSPFNQKFPWETDNAPDFALTDEDMRYYTRRGGMGEIPTNNSTMTGPVLRIPSLSRGYSGGGYQPQERQTFSPDIEGSTAQGMAPLGNLTPQQRQTGRKNYK